MQFSDVWSGTPIDIGRSGCSEGSLAERASGEPPIWLRGPTAVQSASCYVNEHALVPDRTLNSEASVPSAFAGRRSGAAE